MTASDSVRNRANVLGVGISPTNLEGSCKTMLDWLGRGEKTYVCVTGIHGVIESQRDEALRSIHNKAGMVTPDGMPMVWLSRLQGFSDAGRAYGPDLMLRLCELSSPKYTHFFFGGEQGVPELLAERLIQRFPRLQVAGTYSPPFRELSGEEDRAVVDRLNASGADVIWVGLGAPKQERWMAAHRAQLEASLLIGVGAAFDFHSGLKSQAPRWMQRSGLEWFYRMLSEPRRLAPRYLINNPLFLWLLLLQGLGLRRRSL